MQAPQWLTSLEQRERALVTLSLAYATEHSAAGAPGHSYFMLIAKLARMLNKQEAAR
jgi:hypothetical protein